jgi:glycosyltransferase involved in cell wall biosynthesis
MKVLIVCSGNTPNFNFQIHQAFIYDQVIAIQEQNKNIIFKYFFIKEKGVIGYLKSIFKFNRFLKDEKPDLIHAHYSISALITIFQRNTPLITTFHGSDINKLSNRIISLPVQLCSEKLIFVSQKLFNLAILKLHKKSIILPCGVNFKIFKPIEDNLISSDLIEKNKFNILFSSSFSNPIKNFKLLKETTELMGVDNINIIELKNLNRNEVANLMNLVDACVLTSYSEGSPQFIKEAMACNCPIVSTNVGDVEEIIKNTKNCYITNFTSEEIKTSLLKIKNKKERTNGFLQIQRYSNSLIGFEILKIYESFSK